MAFAIFDRERAGEDGWFAATRREVDELAMVEGVRHGGRQYVRRLVNAGVIELERSVAEHVPNRFRLRFPSVGRRELYARLWPDVGAAVHPDPGGRA